MSTPPDASRFSVLDSLDAGRYDRIGASWLTDRLGRFPLLMQGPMGSALMQYAGCEDVPAAYWNIAEPQEVIRLHSLYRAVGADIMLTNTFQASAPALARDGIGASMEDVNRAAVACAKRAGAPCVIGSMGPCGLSWEEPETSEFRAVRAAYREQAHALLDAGAHGILLETFTSLHDLQPALTGVMDVASGMPVLVSFAVDDECRLLGDGAELPRACKEASGYGVASVGVNCCSLAAANAAVPLMARAVDLPISVRPNAGAPHRDDEGALVWEDLTGRFADACARWCDDGASIVGGCCGTDVQVACVLSGCLEERSPQ